jgi:hypothetical protein
MWLTRELHDTLRGLAVAATGMPASQYRDGYHAALLSMAVALGIDGDVAPVAPPAARQDSGFEGSGWIGAFAGLGG